VWCDYHPKEQALGLLPSQALHLTFLSMVVQYFCKPRTKHQLNSGYSTMPAFFTKKIDINILWLSRHPYQLCSASLSLIRLSEFTFSYFQYENAFVTLYLMSYFKSCKKTGEEKLSAYFHTRNFCIFQLQVIAHSTTFRAFTKMYVSQCLFLHFLRDSQCTDDHIRPFAAWAVTYWSQPNEVTGRMWLRMEKTKLEKMKQICENNVTIQDS
jgi:hypothetical protein